MSTVLCPECNRGFRIPADANRRKLKCPYCTARFAAEFDDPDLQRGAVVVGDGESLIRRNIMLVAFLVVMGAVAVLILMVTCCGCLGGMSYLGNQPTSQVATTRSQPVTTPIKPVPATSSKPVPTTSKTRKSTAP